MPHTLSQLFICHYMANAAIDNTYKKQAWLCANKTLLINSKTGCEQDLAPGLSFDKR